MTVRVTYWKRWLEHFLNCFYFRMGKRYYSYISFTINNACGTCDVGSSILAWTLVAIFLYHASYLPASASLFCGTVCHCQSSKRSLECLRLYWLTIWHPSNVAYCLVSFTLFDLCTKNASCRSCQSLHFLEESFPCPCKHIILLLFTYLAHFFLIARLTLHAWQEGGGEPPHGSLGWAIDADFGSLEKLIQKMNAEGAAVQGSGWVVSY